MEENRKYFWISWNNLIQYYKEWNKLQHSYTINIAWTHYNCNTKVQHYIVLHISCVLLENNGDQMTADTEWHGSAATTGCI